MKTKLDYEKRQILSIKAQGYDEGYISGYNKGYEVALIKKDIEFIHNSIKNNINIKSIIKVLGKDISQVIEKAKEYEII